MTIPSENPSNSPAHSSTETGSEQTPRRPDTAAHERLADQEKDNVELLSAAGKVTPQEKQDLIDKAKQWQRGGDLDLLRAAGLSLDQIKKAPLDRHIRFAAMFLTRQPSAGYLEFTANFYDNAQAPWDLDLSDLLPPNVLKVEIVDQNGKVMFADATRGFKENKPGYFTTKGERASIQTGWKIRFKQTQSSLAIKDQKQGKQTYENALKEEMYLVDNSQKTALKQEVRTQADKKGLDVVTDKNFFDTILSDLMKSVGAAFGPDFQKDGKVDFSKFLEQILVTVTGIGIAKSATSAPATAPTAAPTAAPTPPTTSDKSSEQQKYFDQSKLDKVSKSAEKGGLRIDRNWLLENVGRSNEEVQKFLVGVNFMGANMRVNKLIAPYLIEAEQRIKSAGLDFQCKQGECSCQNWRPIRGGTAQSMHSWGTAIDLNVSTNPWQPNLKGNNHGGKMISNMPPEVVNIMKSVGFSWGGEWSGPADPMHFEMINNPYKNQNVLQSASARSAASKYLA